MELEQVCQDTQIVLVEDVDLDRQIIDAVGQIPVGLVAHHVLDVPLSGLVICIRRVIGVLLHA